MKIYSCIFFTLGILSLGLSFFDKSFDYKWLSLFLYLSSLLIGIYLSLFHLINWKKIFSKINYHFLQLFLAILVLTFTSSFLYLKSYPFIAFGDEIRDGGLNTVQIYNGEIENIFSYGRYDAHGLIIPTFCSLFYPLFGNTVLTYKVPAAIIGILDILLVFTLVSLIINPKAGFWSALVLITLPLHIFYSRTQIVVIFSSFLTTILLCGLYLYLYKKNKWRFILFGLLIGLCLNFHASVKSVALILLSFVLLNEFLIYLKKKTNLISYIKNQLILIFFILIGFGPRVWFTPINILFHTSRFSLSDPNFFQNNNAFIVLIHKYFISLGVWFFEPTKSFFNNNSPLLSPLLLIFLLISLVSIFFIKKNNYWLKILIFLGLFIPFSNSAITDGLNYDHRLAPLFPIAAILIGYGIYLLNTKIKNTGIRIIISTCIFIFFIFQSVQFFIQKRAEVNWNNFYSNKDYLSMYLINLVKEKPLFFSSSNLCVNISLNNFSYFQSLYTKEQYSYFLPNKSINFIADEKLTDNIMKVSDCYNKKYNNIYYKECNKSFDFSCPKKNPSDYLIYY